MQARITPSLCGGSVHIPPSKSMAHRSIICASLANGKSIITNVAFSKDILVTIDGMRKLGAIIETKDDAVIITGIKDFKNITANEIHCGESGSTLRFFIPIFSLCNKTITFTGEGRLLQRPQKIYEDMFHNQQLQFEQTDNGITIDQALHHGDYHLRGDVSSQFISGLLFTLPLLDDDSTIHIQPPFESRSYVELTLQMLADYGITASFIDDHTLHIPGKQHYCAKDYEIEGDYSQLAFFAVLGAIQQGIDITGVRHDSRQGDKAILDILQSFGTEITNIEHGYHIHKGNLHGTSIDLANCPDLGPILTVLAMYAKGDTTIYNAGRLRIKESDRIAAMEQELAKFGVSISSTKDQIFMTGKAAYSCTKPLHGHNDHRIVMALSIASTCSESVTTIDDAQAISKSYPAFFDDFASVNGKVELL